MSQESVAIVEASLNAFARGGLDACAEYLADDIDYRAIEGAPDDDGPLKGEDAVRAYMQDRLDPFDDLRSEVVELIMQQLSAVPTPARPTAGSTSSTL